MSLTYTDDTRTDNAEMSFTPVYARGKSRKKKGVKTWMILAPIGAVVLAGSAAAMLMGGGEAAPTVDQPTPAVSAMAPIAQPPLIDSGLTAAAATPAPIAAAPVAAPAPRAAPVAEPASRAPVAERRTVAEPTPVAVDETPAEPTGPTPYTAELNAAPPASASTVTEAPRAPLISTQPLN